MDFGPGSVYRDPPDKHANSEFVISDHDSTGTGAIRRSRRTVYQEISPISGIKPMKLKSKFERKSKRVAEERENLKLSMAEVDPDLMLRSGLRGITNTGITIPKSTKADVKSVTMIPDKELCSTICDAKEMMDDDKNRDSETDSIEDEAIKISRKIRKMSDTNSDMIEDSNSTDLNTNVKQATTIKKSEDVVDVNSAQQLVTDNSFTQLNDPIPNSVPMTSCVNNTHGLDKQNEHTDFLNLNWKPQYDQNPFSSIPLTTSAFHHL